MFETGKITKMKLYAYADNTFTGTPVGTFEAMVNPETLSRTYTANFADDGNLMTDQTGRFTGMTPEDFSFSLLLDSSGVIRDGDLLNIPITNPFESGEPEDVTDKLNALLALFYNVNDSDHRPMYVKVIWGDEAGLMKGVVKSIGVNYKLFKPDGKPIRAVVTLTIGKTKNPEEVAAGLQSPDMTHKKTVSAHEHYSMMGYRIYKKTDYYIDVARANKLLSFRKLKQGDTIYFPPLK